MRWWGKAEVLDTMGREEYYQIALILKQAKGEGVVGGFCFTKAIDDWSPRSILEVVQTPTIDGWFCVSSSSASSCLLFLWLDGEP